MTTAGPSTSRSGGSRRSHNSYSVGLGAAFLLIGLVLGLLLSLAQQPPADAVDTPLASDRGWHAIERLEAEQRQLKSTLAGVREAVSTRKEEVAAQTDRLNALQAELDRQRFLAGLVPVRGPGVVVLLDDSTAQAPPGGDPNSYLIHEYDLRDVINLLWLAGSEAMAVNGERIVHTTSIYCVGSTVLVNNTRLSPPYLIRAIGNSRRQFDTLRNPSYLQGLKEKQRLYGLRLEVRVETDLTLPAHSGSLLVQHARPGE